VLIKLRRFDPDQLGFS